MNKKWKISDTQNEIAEKISKEFNISKLVANIIANKGLQNKKEIEIFLNPTRKDFHDPFLMPDMEKAVERIERAINNKEKITIYGDYDVDGITSSTVLSRFLEERGIKPDIYIPDRINEGYGLNQNAIKSIAENRTDLIITVDCGITAIKEVELAKELNMDVVVTDHHEPGAEIPNTIAVVDCKRKDNKYPFSELAGVGVAFKLIQALSIKMNLPEEAYLKYLDIVCIGTISDIVPLVDENRTIAKLGLKLVKQTKNIGLRCLLASIGYKKIDSNTISFGVAPRVNACGRMGQARKALELFLTNNMEQAKKLTEELNECNLKRQEIEKKISDEAIKMIENKEEQKQPCIILGKENWHHGVIGIVSSKITDMYSKPSILLCFEDEKAKGSGRSIPGFDLHEALENCTKYIEQFGGHSMAIGITIQKDNFENFKNEVEEYAKNKNISEIIPEIQIDEKIQLQDISIKDIEELSLLEPFGEGNRLPLFQINGVKISAIRALSEGKHLKLLLKDDGKYIDAIGFNMGNIVDKYTIEDKIDLVGSIEINSYNGTEKMQVNLKDIRHSV